MRDFGVGKKTLEEKIQIEAVALAKEFEKSDGKPQSPSIFTQMAVTNIICAIIFGDRYTETCIGTYFPYFFMLSFQIRIQ